MSSHELTPSEIRRAQQLVARIQGVSACRISTSEGGEITEIHVVAEGGKPPKLVARDVESCLKAELGLDVDHRKIGVVMMESPDRDASSPHDIPHLAPADTVEEFPVEEVPSRFAFRSVNVFSQRDGVRAEVELERDGVDVLGTSQSDNTVSEPLDVIAGATLRAVSEFLDGPTRLCLGMVLKVALGGAEAIVVRVDLIGPDGPKALAGCSIVSGSEHQSAVYAALDAVNRVVGKLTFKSSIEYRIE